MSITVSKAKRCTDCNEPTPVRWLSAEGECPWCAIMHGPRTPHCCNKCGIAFVPDFDCYCNRATRVALDDAEHIVEQEEIAADSD